MTARWALEELVPHDHPMILIDEVDQDPEKGFYSRVRISEDCPFFDVSKSGVPSWVGIEYIAQTVAAQVGLEARQAAGEVALGYLLGSRRFEARVPYFKLGELLTTHIDKEFQSAGLAKYSGSIYSADGAQVVTTSLTLYSCKLEGIQQ